VAGTLSIQSVNSVPYFVFCGTLSTGIFGNVTTGNGTEHVTADAVHVTPAMKINIAE
jgi:hypothetical protein